MRASVFGRIAKNELLVVGRIKYTTLSDDSNRIKRVDTNSVFTALVLAPPPIYLSFETHSHAKKTKQPTSSGAARVSSRRVRQPKYTKKKSTGRAEGFSCACRTNTRPPALRSLPPTRGRSLASGECDRTSRSPPKAQKKTDDSPARTGPSTGQPIATTRRVAQNHLV